MPPRRTASLVGHCGELADPRIERQTQPQLLDIMVIAIRAVLCGADDWGAIETFGKAKAGWWQEFLALPNGLLSHDTFGRGFALLSPVRGQEGGVSWRQAVAAGVVGQGGASDGQPCGRSSTSGARPKPRVTG